MKKEEKQKNNKNDEKISFFEGVEKVEKAPGFFEQIKKSFQDADNSGDKKNETSKNLVLRKDESRKGIGFLEQAKQYWRGIPDAKVTNIPKSELLPKTEISIPKITEAKVVNQNKEIKDKNIPKKSISVPPALNLPKEIKPSDQKSEKIKSSKFVADWSASNILSTNLIKGESTVVYDWGRQIFFLCLNLLSTLVVIGAVYGGLAYWEKKGKEANRILDAEVNVKKAEIAKLKKETGEINIFNQKLGLAKDLLNEHIYWENFFDFLEKNILSDIYLPGVFSGGVDGEYVFRAYTKDLKTMLDQVNYLRQDDKKDKILFVSIANVTPGDELNQAAADTTNQKLKVSFDLILKVNKDIFYKK